MPDVLDAIVLARAMKEKFVGMDAENVVFFCLGTDRSTGDSLGPMVGMLLEQVGYTNVVGTLSNPAHAMNMRDRLKEVEPGKTVIAIDSCLGQKTSIGRFQFDKGPMAPGAGVNKDLGMVGDYHIAGIVNVGGFMEHSVLQNTRLSLVMDMAECIARAIVQAIPCRAFAEVAAARMDENDVIEYTEEISRARFAQRIERQLTARDAFYPPELHRQDVLSRAGINHEESENE